MQFFSSIHKGKTAENVNAWMTMLAAFTWVSLKKCLIISNTKEITHFSRLPLSRVFLRYPRECSWHFLFILACYISCSLFLWLKWKKCVLASAEMSNNQMFKLLKDHLEMLWNNTKCFKEQLQASHPFSTPSYISGRTLCSSHPYAIDGRNIKNRLKIFQNFVPIPAHFLILRSITYSPFWISLNSNNSSKGRAGFIFNPALQRLNWLGGSATFYIKVNN